MVATICPRHNTQVTAVSEYHKVQVSMKSTKRNRFAEVNMVKYIIQITFKRYLNYSITNVNSSD